MPVDHSPRTAIVGAGLIGGWHAHYASRWARVVCVADPDRRRAAELARKFAGASSVASLGGCLNQDAVDAVHVCAPANLHFELASQALEAGVHVLSEKPAAETAEQTERLLHLARSQGKRFRVSLQLPYQPGFREFLQQRDSLGEAVRVEFSAATAGGDGLDSAGRRQVLWEILPHPLSVFGALAGEQALKAEWRVDRFDDQELALSADILGAHWSIFLSLRARPRALKLAWRASRGSADIDFYHGYSTISRGDDSRLDKALRPFEEAGAQIIRAGSNLLGRAVRGEAAYPGLQALIADFYGSLDEGRGETNASTLLGIARIADSVRGWQKDA
jgi:predicted dehydrogenase